MTKYDFDYHVKRAELFTEMARPSPWMQKGAPGETIKNIFDSVGKTMSRGGEVNGEFVPGMGGNRYVNRALRYIIFLLSGMDEADDNDEVSDEEANYEIVSAAANILGIPKEGWRKQFADPDKLYRAAIMKAIDDYPDKILSPEFKQKALDPNNALSYVANNRISNSGSYHAAEKRSERHGGMSAEEIDHAQTGIKDLLVKIHRAMHHDRMRKNPKLAQKEQAENIESPSKFTDDAFLVTDALEVVADNAKTVTSAVNSQLSKFKSKDPETLQFVLNDVADSLGYPVEQVTNLYFANIPLLKALHTKYTDLHSVGVDLPAFKSKMEKFAANSPELSETIQLVLSEIGELESIYSQNNEQPVGNGGPFDEFPAYPSSVLEMFLKTPQDIEGFRKFYKHKANEVRGAIDKKQRELESVQGGYAEVAGEKEAMRRGFKQFLAKRNKGVNNQVDEFEDPAPISKPVGPVRKEPIQTQSKFRKPRYEEEEIVSPVMNYMTEQVSKDRFKSKGEFKDRGCKKMSYHEWIVRNQ